MATKYMYTVQVTGGLMHIHTNIIAKDMYQHHILPNNIPTHSKWYHL